LTKGVDGLYGARPIFDWTSKDAFLAVKRYEWPLNAAYSKLWRSGCSVNEARVAPLFCAEGASEDLRRVMLYWPDFWAKVRRRVRGADACALHNGKLHAALRLPGETWQVAEERYRLALSPEDRAAREAFVRKSIGIHLRHSAQPLSESVRCFKCSVCWRDVARLYALGDRHDSRGLKHHAGLRLAELRRLTG
jgi:predicted phosphoadenosine phosphosulfate sulfurtransferase